MVLISVSNLKIIQTVDVEGVKMKYIGVWHIVEMEMWDEDYFNMEVQAFISVKENRLGSFQFGLVSGQIDGEVSKYGDKERFEFTWDGNDECDPAQGSGWFEEKTEKEIMGRIKIHLGDSSAFRAAKVE